MIKNLVEEHVLAAFGALKQHYPEFCGCQLCAADVLVFTLNRVPPRYVASLEGTVVTEVALEKDQSRAAIDVVVMEGIRKVSMAPRCGRAGVRAPA